MLGQRALLVGIATWWTWPAGMEATDDPEVRLLDYLFKNSSYNKNVRPGIIKNGTKYPLTVSVSFALNRLLELNGQMETMSVMVFISEEWTDHRLKWNPRDFGGKKTVVTQANTVWTPSSYLPSIGFMNVDDKAERISVRIYVTDDEDMNAWVELTTYANLQERCKFDITYFPFDIQNCSICIVQSLYFLDEVVYKAMYAPIDTYMDGGEWNLVGVTVHSGAYVNSSAACFVVTAQRRSLSYVINLFLPTVTICILNTATLFASIDAERSELDFGALGQTTLLSLGVLLLTVADQTPKGASQVSLLGVFFLAMIFQTLEAATVAMYLKKWHRKPLPKTMHIYRVHTISPFRSKSAIPAGRVRFAEFLRKQTTRICMVLNFVAILLITMIALAAGYFNGRKAIAKNEIA